MLIVCAGAVLVHGLNGISRRSAFLVHYCNSFTHHASSAALLIGYLMESSGLPFAYVFTHAGS